MKITAGTPSTIDTQTVQGVTSTDQTASASTSSPNSDTALVPVRDSPR